MIYHRAIPVEFNHCDPAGIVFYPRYFEMTNSVAENFFREVVGHSYASMMTGQAGVPTARIEATFHAPSRLGDVLDWRLEVTRLGGSSASVAISAWCGVEAQARLSVQLVLVYAVLAGDAPAAAPWPAEIRSRIAAFMAAPQG